MTTNPFDIFYHKVSRYLGIGSQSDLAAQLGIHRSAITQAKKNHSVPDAWVLKLAEQFQIDPVWLKKGDLRDRDFAPEMRHMTIVPRVRARLHAGAGSFEVSPEVASCHAFDRNWLRRRGQPEKMVLMDVVGDSMAPVIEAGDTVLIDQSQANIYAGRIYAVGIDDTVVVKRVEKHPRHLVLISANSAYSPLLIDAGETTAVRIIGRVIWICRELP